MTKFPTTPTGTRPLQTGFSLTELMVAITIGLVILAAVATIFVNTNKAYNNQAQLARTQENGRFAMYYLSRDLRMASFTGCQKFQDDYPGSFQNDLSANTGFFFGDVALRTPIEGIDDVTSGSTPTWAPSGNASLPGNASPPGQLWKDSNAANFKPDLLAIREVNTAATASVKADMATVSDNITVSDVTPFKAGNIVLIADCQSADLFEISDIPAGTKQLAHGTSCGTNNPPCNADGNLKAQYGTLTGPLQRQASVYKFSTRRYFIGLNNNNVPSLYVDENGGGPTELVEGIETMKILYGVNTAGGAQPSVYVKASALAATLTANSGARVVSVKIGILARTPDSRGAVNSSDTYNVNGTIIGPLTDGISRRVFVTTISLKDQMSQ